MYCSKCGLEIHDASNYCSSCGAQQRSVTAPRQLTLSASDKKLGGVCGGLAEYLHVDSTVVRLIWVALSVVPGGFVGGAIAYLLAWIIIPKAPAYTLAPATTDAGAVSASPRAS